MQDARAELDTGIRFQRSGSLAQALVRYESVERAADSPALVAEALRRKADVLRSRCEWDAALRAARAGAETAIRSELPELFAEALNSEAAIYLSRGDFTAAVPLLEKILLVAAQPRIIGVAHENLGQIAAMSNDLDVAADHFSKSRNRFHEAGYDRGEAIALNNQAAVANLAGDYARALELSEEALIASRTIDDHELVALASLNRAEALIRFDRFREAEQLASQAYGFFGIEGNRFRQVGCLRLLGDIYRWQENRNGAIRCYERGLKMADAVDARTEAELLESRIEELTASGAA